MCNSQGSAWPNIMHGEIIPLTQSETVRSQPLTWLHNFKEAEGQVERWQEALNNFDFEKSSQHLNLFVTPHERAVFTPHV